MTWAYLDCDVPLWVSKKRAEFPNQLKERVLEEEGKRKEVETQLETKGVELDGAQADLATARAKVARLEAEFSKSREDILMEAFHLQARAEAAKRKAAEVADEVAKAKAMALSEYQSSVEF